jgi:hypothetical protein
LVTNAPDDLEAKDAGPPAPELVSVLLVKPASQVGCQCRPDCIEEPGIEFTLRTSAPRSYVRAASIALFIDRVEATPDDEARFYAALITWFWPEPPSSFSVSAVDAAGLLSEAITVPYDASQDPEYR